ncbi:hypothetical protein Tco_0859831, partial [Tanacetum coccineum]
METKDTLSSCSNSKEQQKQQIQDKAKESCIVFSHLMALSNNDLKGTSIEGGFEQAFATLFEQDVQTFTRTMFVKLYQLEKHLSKEEYQELESYRAFRVLLQQFRRSSIHDSRSIMMKESIQERPKHKREYDRRLNDRMMQLKEGKVDSSKALDASLVVTECSETKSDKQDTRNMSWNDADIEDADIRP